MEKSNVNRKSLCCDDGRCGHTCNLLHHTKSTKGTMAKKEDASIFDGVMGKLRQVETDFMSFVSNAATSESQTQGVFPYDGPDITRSESAAPSVGAGVCDPTNPGLSVRETEMDEEFAKAEADLKAAAERARARATSTVPADAAETTETDGASGQMQEVSLDDGNASGNGAENDDVLTTCTHAHQMKHASVAAPQGSTGPGHVAIAVGVFNVQDSKGDTPLVDWVHAPQDPGLVFLCLTGIGVGDSGTFFDERPDGDGWLRLLDKTVFSLHGQGAPCRLMRLGAELSESVVVALYATASVAADVVGYAATTASVGSIVRRVANRNTHAVAVRLHVRGVSIAVACADTREDTLSSTATSLLEAISPQSAQERIDDIVKLAQELRFDTVPVQGVHGGSGGVAMSTVADENRSNSVSLRSTFLESGDDLDLNSVQEVAAARAEELKTAAVAGATRVAARVEGVVGAVTRAMENAQANTRNDDVIIATAESTSIHGDGGDFDDNIDVGEHRGPLVTEHDCFFWTGSLSFPSLLSKEQLERASQTNRINDIANCDSLHQRIVEGTFPLSLEEGPIESFMPSRDLFAGASLPMYAERVLHRPCPRSALTLRDYTTVDLRDSGFRPIIAVYDIALERFTSYASKQDTDTAADDISPDGVEGESINIATNGESREARLLA